MLGSKNKDGSKSCYILVKAKQNTEDESKTVQVVVQEVYDNN